MIVSGSSCLLAVSLLTSCIVSCAAQKNLVIVGGSLADNNAQIYGKVIELAVRARDLEHVVRHWL